MTCGIGILRILPAYFVRLVFPSCLFFAARVAVFANGCSFIESMDGHKWKAVRRVAHECGNGLLTLRKREA